MTNLISMCWKCIHWEECKMFMKEPNPNITECNRFVKAESKGPYCDDCKHNVMTDTTCGHCDYKHSLYEKELKGETK